MVTTLMNQFAYSQMMMATEKFLNLSKMTYKICKTTFLKKMLTTANLAESETVSTL